MNSKRLTEVVMAIREYAINGKYTVYHELKIDDWASQTLNLTSDAVVRNYLMTLQPFQFIKGNDATQVYEFRVDYYRYQASIKVNLRQLEVLSFHDAQPRDEEITTRFSDIAIIPETANVGTRGWICRFAVGSQVVTIPIYPDMQGAQATIPLQDYRDAVQSTERGLQGQFLKEVIDRAGIQDCAGIQNCNRSNIMQLINCGIDLYNEFPSWYRVQDLTVDLLMQIHPQTVELLKCQLHKSRFTLPDLSASQETMLKDWDEE